MTRTERWTFTTTKDSGEKHTATALIDVEEVDESVVMDRGYAATLGMYDGEINGPIEFGPNPGDARMYTRAPVHVPYEKVRVMLEREGGVLEGTA